MNSVVSIIVPVFNVEKYLDRCMDSLVGQTYSCIEIILVDDGSADGSSRMCDAWAAADCRVKVVHQDNAGVGKARNTGLRNAVGEYVMFVDPDDYIAADSVQMLLQRMQADGSDMVIGKHTDVYDDGHTDGRFCQWMEDAVLTPDDVFRQAGEANSYKVSMCVKLFARKVFDGVAFPALACGEDFWLFPILVERCSLISIIDKEFYFYYQRSDSIVHRRAKEQSLQIDDLKASLHFAQFLLRRGFVQSAVKWYGVSVDRALALPEKGPGIELFTEFFSNAEIRCIFEAANMKIRVKTIFLRVPFLYSVLGYVKGFLKGGF